MDSLSRREFFWSVGAGACLLGARDGLAQDVAGGMEGTRPQTALHDAMWFERQADKMVHCQLCPRECVVADAERGYCGVRENRGGDYKTLVYGALCSLNIDPIEKKPLFHYLPGTTALSVATAGCNVECKFCQNWRVSQYRPEQVESVIVPPDRLAQMAKERGTPTMAYTYTEPVVFSEYVHDAAAAGRRQGLGSVMVSNGYIREPAMRDLCSCLTAVKVDLKGFSEKFYSEICAGKLAPVLSTLDVLKDIGIHLEIVMLMIPTLNDAPGEIGEMAKWILAHLGPDVPLHFTRFHPMFRLTNLPPTPVETLERARKVAMDAGLRYVYIGNVPLHEGENTYCHSCRKIVIRRVGYNVNTSNLKDGRCGSCGTAIPGVWTPAQALAFKAKEKRVEPGKPKASVL